MNKKEADLLGGGYLVEFLTGRPHEKGAGTRETASINEAITTTQNRKNRLNLLSPPASAERQLAVCVFDTSVGFGQRGNKGKSLRRWL